MRHFGETDTPQKVHPDSRQLEGEAGPDPKPAGIVIRRRVDGQEGGGEQGGG